MTSQTWQKIISIYIYIYIYIYCSISKLTKGNHTMKFGQLIEYKSINIFLEELYTKCGGEASPRLFYKNSKLSISLDQQPEMLQIFFLLYV